MTRARTHPHTHTLELYCLMLCHVCFTRNLHSRRDNLLPRDDKPAHECPELELLRGALAEPVLKVGHLRHEADAHVSGHVHLKKPRLQGAHDVDQRKPALYLQVSDFCTIVNNNNSNNKRHMRKDGR